MLRKIAILAPLAIALSSCSYGYDLAAVVRDGELVFAVSQASSQQPVCLRRIEVTEEGERETVWSESVSYDDDCANKFPIAYGMALQGRHRQDHQEIARQPLRRGVIYNVSTTTGTTGYGGGRFLLKTDGQVENLPWPSANPQENAAAS